MSESNPEPADTKNEGNSTGGNPPSIPEGNEGVDRFEFTPRKLPATLRKQTSMKEIIRQLFEDHPILFQTELKTENTITVKDYNFSKLYRELGNLYQLRSEFTAKQHVGELKTNGEIIAVNREQWADWFLQGGINSPVYQAKIANKYTPISADTHANLDWKYPNFKFTLDEIRDLLRGKDKFIEIGKVDYSVLPKPNKFMLLVANFGKHKDNAQKFLMDEVLKIVASLPLAPPREEKAPLMPVSVIKIEQDHLASFEHQTIYYPSQNPVTIEHLYSDLILFINCNLQRVCLTCGHRLGDPSKGGMTGVIDATLSIDLAPDPEIVKMTLIAEQYGRNKPSACVSLADLSNGSVTMQSVPPKQFRDIQNEYRKTLLCPNPDCPSRARGELLIKIGLFHVDHIFQRIVEAQTIGVPFILVGEPGDGKSTILEQWLQYLWWRFNVPYKILGIDESISAGKLTASVNLQKAFSGEKELRDYVLGFVSASLITPEYGGEPCNIGLDELNRTHPEELQWMMPWLASPFEYLLPAAGNMKVRYPNKVNADKTVWSMGCTMNTRDINNNPLSDAFKERFMMISVGFEGTDGDFRVQDILRLRFHIEFDKKTMHDALDHWVIKYLFAIYKLTETMQAQRETRFKSGIRQLERIHQVFIRSVASRLKTMGIYEATTSMFMSDAEKVDKTWEKEKSKVDNINIYTKKSDTSEAIEIVVKDIFNKVVETNLLNNIMEENNEVKTKKIRARWEQFANQQSFWNIVIKGLKSDGLLEAESA